MTDAVTDLSAEQKAWLEVWEKCTQTVISQITGQPVVFEVTPEAAPGAASDMWYTVVVAGAVRGEMTLRLPAASGVRLAQKFLQEPESASVEPTSEHKEALEELVRQVAGQAATALSSTVGEEIQVNVAASAPPSWSPSGTRSLHTRDEAGASVTIEIQISAALTATLPHLPETHAAAQPALAPASAASYERLRDVILDVKLRFGSRRMVLRDILALSAGVVVELDSHVNSPVDLLLDGRMIAQGEVVVVDGKYGLRVTHVIDSGSPS